MKRTTAIATVIAVLVPLVSAGAETDKTTRDVNTVDALYPGLTSGAIKG